MPKDGLRRLPDHIVAPLLRALMCIPRTRDARLILQRPDEPRPPVRQLERDADFNVLWQGQIIGRIWRCDYSRDTSGDMARYLWHWRWQHVDDRADAQGHAPTLESAMADFRRAWDLSKPEAEVG
jgi:hypothetical protein